MTLNLPLAIVDPSSSIVGASFSIKNGYVHGSVKGKLKGTSINFKKKSVGATENLIMAATLAEGKTIIHNAAQEPEIDDLCNFLIQIGAKIKGHGTDLVTIDGVNELNGGEFEVMPDRIEAGTFALSVLGCSGDLILTGVNNQIYKHLKDIFKPIKFLKLKIIDDKSFSVVKVKDGELNLKDSVVSRCINSHLKRKEEIKSWKVVDVLFIFLSGLN